MDKRGTIARGEALDHGATLAPIWHFPRPLKLHARREELPEWTPARDTFADWLVKAENWLCQAYEEGFVGKGRVTASEAQRKHVPIDQKYTLILSVQRVLDHVRQQGTSPTVVRKLKRKCRLLGCDFQGDLSESADQVAQELKKHLDDKQRLSLDSWRRKVREWLPSQSYLYHYIKNPLPAKPHVIKLDEHHATQDPLSTASELNAYWGKLRAGQHGTPKNPPFFS